jgi:hypothetical protein
MKKVVLCFMLLLSGGLFGCSIAKQSSAITPELDKDEVQLPICFSNYCGLYTFIAKHEGLSASADVRFQLAADSETKIYALDEPPSYVWVIEPHFFNGGIFDEIRGAQGNGTVYLVCPLAENFTSGDTNHGFELVGIARGNTVRFSSVNHIPRLIVNWHVSAAEAQETIYEWNGKFFKPLKPDKSISGQ